MELPSRQKGDVYTKAGEYPALRQRIRSAAVGLSIPTVVVYAFDKRTRLLPSILAAIAWRRQVRAPWALRCTNQA